MINYIIQEDSIVFFDGENTKILSDINTLMFKRVKEYLKAGNLDKVKAYSSYDTYVSEEFPGLELINDVYHYNGQPLKNLSSTVKNFILEGLPLSPILRFIEKTQELESVKLQEQVQKAVADGNYPLTWEGDLVAYKRSSWNATSLKAPEFSNTEEYQAAYKEFKQRMFDIFVPGQYVEVARRNDNLLVSSFNWVSNSCPDTGAFYDVKVLVKDIVSVSNTNILTKGYINLEKLSETYVEDKKSVTGVLMQVWTGTNKYGEQVVIKQPLDFESVQLYMQELISGSNVNNSFVPEVVTQPMSC